MAQSVLGPMNVRVAVDTNEVPVTDAVMAAMGRAVEERIALPVFAGVRDLRIRFRNIKGALLCVVAVGLSSGGLATSTATSGNALDAVVGALDGLPDSIGRVSRNDPRASTTSHAAVRAQLKLLLDRTAV